MAFDERLITVAIHTCERAVALKEKLEREGVYATLQNINLEHPVVASGMRVRIKESDLAKALLIIESDEPASQAADDFGSERQEILVPVDFSPYSLEACIVAFRIATKQNASVTLLNTHYSQIQPATTQLSDALTYDKPVPESSAEAVESARTQFEGLRKMLERKLPRDVVEAVKVKTLIQQGLPEEVINQYSKEHSPMLIVMGTRGADKKGRDLVGSVTAEVLDTCRRPVLTIPEGISADDVNEISKVLYFCNGEQCDILAIQRLHELIGDQFNRVTLANLQTKRRNISSETLESLRRYCAEHFPQSDFSSTVVKIMSSDDSAASFDRAGGIGLIAIPNKRKSAFARLFNPGIAHRLLFRADIPMMVIPV